MRRSVEQVIASMSNDPAGQANYIAKRVATLRRKEYELMAMASSDLVRQLAFKSADIEVEIPPVSECF